MWLSLALYEKHNMTIHEFFSLFSWLLFHSFLTINLAVPLFPLISSQLFPCRISKPLIVIFVLLLLLYVSSSFRFSFSFFTLCLVYLYLLGYEMTSWMLFVCSAKEFLQNEFMIIFIPMFRYQRSSLGVLTLVYISNFRSIPFIFAWKTTDDQTLHKAINHFYFQVYKGIFYRFSQN